MASYVEERTFDLHLLLRVEFPEDYDGDLDGYAWAEEVPAVAAEVVRAAVAAIARRPGWRVRPGNRGRPADEEVTLVLDRAVDG
jgi:hypothetical protein